MASGWRRKSREAALQLVYQVELGGDRSEASLERFWIRLPGATDDARDYGKFLADVVFERMEQIDAAIERATENWQIDRISRVDLCLLRVAAGELVFVPETPARVVINEAVDIAKRFSGGGAPAFINGVLDRIASAHGRLADEGEVR